MSIRYQCDICLTLFNNINQVQQAELPLVMNEEVFQSGEIIKKDMCYSCAKVINTYILEIQRKKNV